MQNGDKTVDVANQAALRKPGAVARQFDVSHATVRKWAEDGILNPIKIGRVVRYRAEEVEKLLK